LALLIAGVVLYLKFLSYFSLVPAFNQKKWSISAYFLALVCDEILRSAFFIAVLVIQI
jgi:hypothetical protein